MAQWNRGHRYPLARRTDGIGMAAFKRQSRLVLARELQSERVQLLDSTDREFEFYEFLNLTNFTNFFSVEKKFAKNS